MSEFTTLNPNAWRLLASILELASDEFSNHGCNDYTLPNTPENRALLVALEVWNDKQPHDESELNYSRDRKQLYMSDASLMGYFAHLARELAGEKQ